MGKSSRQIREELANLFLKFGIIGFGGFAAHIAKLRQK